MRVWISIAADDDGTALTDLHRRLTQDDDLRRHARPRLRPTRQTGGSLGSVEVVEPIIGQTIALANLAVAYATWRRSRTTRAPVTITANGISLTVHDGSEESVRQITELLRSKDAAPGEDETTNGPTRPPSDG